MFNLFTLLEKSLLTVWFLAVVPFVSSSNSWLNYTAAMPPLIIRVPTNGISIVTTSPFLTLSDKNL
jgi:hypothetical protein